MLISVFMKGNSSKYLCYAWASWTLTIWGTEESTWVLITLLCSPIALWYAGRSQWRKFGNWDKTNRKNMSRVKKQDRNYCIMQMWDLALLVGNYCIWSVTRSRVLLERSRDTIKWGNNGCVEIINRFHQRQGFGLISLGIVIDDLGAQNRMQEWCLMMTQSWELFAGPKKTKIFNRKNGVMLSVRINNTYGLNFSLYGLGLVPRNNEFGNREEERFECSNGSQDTLTVET